MADKTTATVQAPTDVSLSPAQEAGPDLPDRTDVPQWVPQGQEERWHNSVKVAGDLFPGHRDAVWQTARTIFNDRETYPD